MGQFHCDRCGRGLLVDHDVRYEVKIEVKAGFDPPELTGADMRQDYAAKIRDLIAKIERRDTREMEEEVFMTRRYDLCPPCRKEWIADPLGIGASPPDVSG